MLATQGLGRNFGGLAAVRGVSIALQHGELHAVIGPNGAGKTTLVNLLAGALKPSAGASSSTARRGRRTRLAHGAPRCRPLLPAHQHPANLSVLENVRLAVQAVVTAQSAAQRAETAPIAARAERDLAPGRPRPRDPRRPGRYRMVSNGSSRSPWRSPASQGAAAGRAARRHGRRGNRAHGGPAASHASTRCC